MTSSGDRKIIFVSCGQVTDEEKALGFGVCELVESRTKFKAYYAENQTSLEGLSRNILTNLGKCVGLIAIMHPRGEVKFPDGSKRIRASVWIEQEIAVAAYLKQVAGVDIKIAAYVHKSIQREGMRDQLHLNPHPFSENSEVLAHLTEVLKNWIDDEHPREDVVAIDVKYLKVRINSERHDYRLEVRLQNLGSEPIERFHVDIEMPSEYVPTDIVQVLEVKERQTQTARLFRASDSTRRVVLYPGDPVLVCSIEYFVDSKLYKQKYETFSELVKITVYIPGQKPIKKEMPMQNLQIF